MNNSQTFEVVARDLMDGMGKTEIVSYQSIEELYTKNFTEREADKGKMIDLAINLLAGHKANVTREELADSKVFTRDLADGGFQVYISIKINGEDFGLTFLYSEEAIALLPQPEA